MTISQSLVLQLIRKAVDPNTEVKIPSDVNWEDVIEFSLRQGVIGITFDAFSKLRGDIDFELMPDELSIMRWYVYANLNKQRYYEHKKTIESLAAFYAKQDICMMLLKGYGLSLYWPVPELRPSGDIDIFLFGDWKRADQLVHEELGIEVDEGHEHHTCFNYNAFPIENHYDFINTKGTKSSIWIEEKFKELAGAKPFSNKISFPCVDLNTIFLIRHLGQHFAGAEATLRQVLDWGFFMSTESKNVNWNDIIPFLRRMGIYDFFCCVNEICAKEFGFTFNVPEGFNSFNSKLSYRILSDIIDPEFGEQKPMSDVISVIAFKTHRFFANSWKRKLVYKEGIMNQLIHGSIAHLMRWETIKD